MVGYDTKQHDPFEDRYLFRPGPLLFTPFGHVPNKFILDRKGAEGAKRLHLGSKDHGEFEGSTSL